MTKKDYIAVASELSQLRRFDAVLPSDTICMKDCESNKLVRLDLVEQMLINFFSADNPNFDEGRFLAACRKE